MQTVTPSPHNESNETPAPHNESNETPATQSTIVSLSSNREAPSPPALSACNKNTQKSLPSNINRTEETAAKSAPNQLVKWNELKDLLDENLGPCGICQNTDRHLVEQKFAMLHPLQFIALFAKRRSYKNTTVCSIKLPS